MLLQPFRVGQPRALGERIIGNGVVKLAAFVHVTIRAEGRSVSPLFGSARSRFEIPLAADLAELAGGLGHF
jgi:hypothetical protein